MKICLTICLKSRDLTRRPKHPVKVARQDVLFSVLVRTMDHLIKLITITVSTAITLMSGNPELRIPTGNVVNKHGFAVVTDDPDSYTVQKPITPQWGDVDTFVISKDISSVHPHLPSLVTSPSILMLWVTYLPMMLPSANSSLMLFVSVLN